jgi:hypothetical protein
VELLPAVVDALLERWPVARLATVGPDGPRQVPVVFARAGEALWSPMLRIEPASVRSWCAGPGALSQASAALGVPA